jgi:hypothetical protein
MHSHSFEERSVIIELERMVGTTILTMDGTIILLPGELFLRSCMTESRERAVGASEPGENAL